VSHQAHQNSCVQEHLTTSFPRGGGIVLLCKHRILWKDIACSSMLCHTPPCFIYFISIYFIRISRVLPSLCRSASLSRFVLGGCSGFVDCILGLGPGPHGQSYLRPGRTQGSVRPILFVAVDLYYSVLCPFPFPFAFNKHSAQGIPSVWTYLTRNWWPAPLIAHELVQRYALLQSIPTTSFSVQGCRLQRSKMPIYCGVYNHQAIIISDIWQNRPVEISPEDSRSYWRRQEIKVSVKPTNSQWREVSFQLALNNTTKLRYNSHGKSWAQCDHTLRFIANLAIFRVLLRPDLGSFINNLRFLDLYFI
jgi:hypothetical protein